MNQFKSLAMIRSLILLISILISCIAFGQTTKVYFNKNHEKVHKADAVYCREYTYVADLIFNSREYNVKTGKLRETGVYTTTDSGFKNGNFVYYNDSGKKESEGQYEVDKKTGIWKNYRESSGKLWYTETFSFGKLDGELISYYPSGKVKRKEQHSTKDTIVTGKCYNEKGIEIPFTRFQVMPSPTYSLPGYLGETLRYPAYANEHNIMGNSKVYDRG